MIDLGVIQLTEDQALFEHQVLKLNLSEGREKKKNDQIEEIHNHVKEEQHQRKFTLKKKNAHKETWLFSVRL